MSTQATYEFIDKNQKVTDESFTVYKSHGGYPDRAYRWIKNSLEFAWELPRFEASDFAAAFIRANKHEPGDVRISSGLNSHSNTEYQYVVSIRNGEIWVEQWEPVKGSCYSNKYSKPNPAIPCWTRTQKGLLKHLFAKYVTS